LVIGSQAFSGAAAAGAGWGSVGVGAAIAISPLAVVAIIGLVGFGVYTLYGAASGG
jgi:hypothetical protein